MLLVALPLAVHIKVQVKSQVGVTELFSQNHPLCFWPCSYLHFMCCVWLHRDLPQLNNHTKLALTKSRSCSVELKTRQTSREWGEQDLPYSSGEMCLEVLRGCCGDSAMDPHPWELENQPRQSLWIVQCLIVPRSKAWASVRTPHGSSAPLGPPDCPGACRSWGLASAGGVNKCAVIRSAHLLGPSSSLARSQLASRNSMHLDTVLWGLSCTLGSV